MKCDKAMLAEINMYVHCGSVEHSNWFSKRNPLSSCHCSIFVQGKEKKRGHRKTKQETEEDPKIKVGSQCQSIQFGSLFSLKEKGGRERPPGKGKTR